ncbi:hypothetical protein Pen02_81180 [Plantactinospora endophytica]|uniref:Uncharacterized protein n=1 Tax=Plantactinospora endophytica TaxID=673535 RepID=A0ABQ4EG15_9ACTN|nr:hypothetical protein Pen02_81180 [Plantactinospora endophytica]
MPSGVWSFEEYEKLRNYDAPTYAQPTSLWQCHQTDAGSDHRRLCAGWVGCHGGDHLLALRLALAEGRICADILRAAADFISPVPLFASASDAANHGQAEITEPGEAARRVIAKVTQSRQDLLGS